MALYPAQCQMGPVGLRLLGNVGHVDIGRVFPLSPVRRRLTPGDSENQHMPRQSRSTTDAWLRLAFAGSIHAFTTTNALVVAQPELRDYGRYVSLELHKAIALRLEAVG